MLKTIWIFGKKFLQVAFDKLHDCVIIIVEQTVLDALETCKVHHDKVFIKAALSKALDRLLVFVPNDLSGRRKFFEDVIFQVATAPKALSMISSAFAKYTPVMPLIAWYIARIVKQEADDSVKDIDHTPPSAPLSGLESSLDEIRKRRKDRRSMEKSSRLMSYVMLSKKIRPLKRSMKETAKPFESSRTSSDTEQRAPKL